MLARQTKFIVAMAFQVVVILAIIAAKYSILIGGTSILLQIAPVDPRDPLRGDYITFQYELSQLDSRLFETPVKPGDTVYVLLRQDGPRWVAYRVLTRKPLPGQEMILKGKIVSGGWEGGAPPTRPIRVVYGIEDYFIPEGQGRDLGVWRQGRPAFARVVVDDHGNAVLQQLYAGDRPWP